MIQKITPDLVAIGMYIHGFGGSWFDHPFWMTKFVLRSPDDLDKIRRSAVPYVLIDVSRGLRPAPPPVALHGPSRPVRPKPRPEPKMRYAPAEPSRMRPRTAFDRAKATAVVAHARLAVQSLYEQAMQGKAIDPVLFTRTADQISRAVGLNPQIFLDVVRFKDLDSYTHLHSVAVCAMMANLARHVGKCDAETAALGQAGLLHDIGKVGVPPSILNKPRALDDDEFEVVKSHPEAGHKLLLQGDGVHPYALEVCLHHHEKIDGSGYPEGLMGDAISEAARMGAICDVYDAMTSDRAYKSGWSPEAAITAMWSWEGHFDRSLLFRFCQSIATFPIGMLVQLRSNRLGLVVPRKKRDTGPRVAVCYALCERAPLPCECIVVGDTLARDSIVAEADEAAFAIPGLDALRERLLAPG